MKRHPQSEVAYFIRRVSQMRALQAACRELAGDYHKWRKVCFLT